MHVRECHRDDTAAHNGYQREDAHHRVDVEQVALWSVSMPQLPRNGTCRRRRDGCVQR